MPTTLERQRCLRELHRALVADAREDVELAVQVGVLVAMGYPKAHIARMLDVRDLVVPLQRLKRVAKSPDRDDEL